jgi:hypothetical protein
MFKTPYENLMHYRASCGMEEVVSIIEALDDLICSHRWMNEQLANINSYMEELEAWKIIETTVDSDGLLNVGELTFALEKTLMHREALLEVVEKHDLGDEYRAVIDRMLTTIYGNPEEN